MIRTIKQRIYVVGMLPLALAMVVVVVNGVLRIEETSETLRNAKKVTAALLHAPAADALVLGNLSGFEKAAQDVVKASPWLSCVILRDAARAVVVQVGECHDLPLDASYSPVLVARGEFSDFPQDTPTSEVGTLGILVQDAGVQQRQRQVLVQLASSLALIVVVVWLIGRVLRIRLIEPLQRIGLALAALSRRDYTARAPVAGNDEVTELAKAVNNTIQTTETYTRELELRRKDADRALQDADEEALLRHGIIRSLTADFEGPLNRMHSELTAIAMANQDPRLRERIKAVIAMAQDAQEDFADLVEVATSAQDPRRSAVRHLSALLGDVRADLQKLSELEGKQIHFNVTVPGDPSNEFATDVMLDLDGVRLKKALILLVRAMVRHCRQNGVYVTVELINLSANQLHLAVQIKAFYEQYDGSIVAPVEADPVRAGLSSMKLLGLTDRESKIVEYLLRAIGIAQTVGVLPSGSAFVSWAMTCNCIREPAAVNSLPEWVSASRQLSATMVSDDSSLMRLTERAGISNHDLKLMSFAKACAEMCALSREDAVLLDMSGDMADAMRLLDLMKAKSLVPGNLIAICPQGQINDSLADQLLEIGFGGVVQKPLYYSRLIRVIRAALDTQRLGRGRGAHG